MLSQMVPYMEFCICVRRYYLTWLYLWLFSRGHLLYIFAVITFINFVCFSSLLIPNPLYVLSVESDHGQILIIPDNNLIAYFCWDNYKFWCSQNVWPWVIFINIGFWNFKIRTRFTRTWLIRSNITLGVGFTEVLGLEIIPYYLSKIIFLTREQ